MSARGPADLPAAPAPEPPRAAGWRTWHRRPWFGPATAVLCLSVIGWLVADHVRAIDWGQVRAALAALRLPTLAAAAALVLLSHLVYASYELIGRRYVGHSLPVHRVLAVGFVSYAFNLNLGALVGGVGLRLRLYSRLGLGGAQITRLIAFSLVTNWSGWLLLAGVVFAARLVDLSPLSVAAGAMQAMGLAAIALPIAYAAACAASKRREWRWRRHSFVLPSGRLALAQLAASTLNWALIGAVLWQLMPAGLSYGAVLATHLSAAVIAVPTHVPGGLGVVEAVFIAALGGQVPTSRLLAALLAFRALYYLVPLALAAALHVAFEVGTRRRAGPAAPG